MPRTVLIASDHGGFALKSALIQSLRKTDCVVEDLGPDCTGSCDYPVFADKLCRSLLDAGEDGQNGQVLGILVCGTGLGMLRLADLVCVTKGDLVSQAEREVYRHRIRQMNSRAVIRHVNGLTGQGCQDLARILALAPEVDDLAERKLRFAMQQM